MHKQYEAEPWRIEHADDAKITFTITLHGKHAWEMLLEDSRRYHSISHGWATDDPHDWEGTIAPVLRQFFVKGRLGLVAESEGNGPQVQPVAAQLAELRYAEWLPARRSGNQHTICPLGAPAA